MNTHPFTPPTNITNITSSSDFKDAGFSDNSKLVSTSHSLLRGNTQRTSRKAFTLIEILIVIGIIALLMGISTQMLSTVGEVQGRSKAKADMALLASALEAFSSKYGSYPRISTADEEKAAASELYKCMVGKMILRVKDGQIAMVDVGTNRTPFIESSKMTIFDPTNPTADVVDPEKNGIYFVDAWGEPYQYMYDTNTQINTDTNAWESPAYVLFSKGPDTKTKNVQRMHTTGIIPTDDEYRTPDENIDDLLHGRDN